MILLVMVSSKSYIFSKLFLLTKKFFKERGGIGRERERGRGEGEIKNIRKKHENLKESTEIVKSEEDRGMCIQSGNNDKLSFS